MNREQMIKAIEWNMTWTIRAVALRCWPPHAIKLNELANSISISLEVVYGK